MPDDHIHLTIEAPLATITLNRPDKLNALTLEMRVELMESFRQIHTDPEIRAVLLRAEGRAFCAGADISTMGKDDVWGDRARLHRAHQMILSIYNCEKPVVAAVRGPAVGIGLSMALACDVLLLSETAKLGQVFRKIGLAPDGGAAFFLQNLIGRQRATDLAFSARLVPAQEALSAEEVNETFDLLPLIGELLLQLLESGSSGAISTEVTEDNK